MERTVQSRPHFPIPSAILPQVAPATFVLSHLLSTSPIRPGGRSPSETRPITLHTGSLTNANGSALVRLGNTSIVCGTRAEVLDVRDIAHYRAASTLGALQSTERANAAEGDTTVAGSLPDGSKENEDDDSELNQYSLLVPNIELQTGASPLPAYQPSSGAPSALAQSLTQRLLSTIYATRLVDAHVLRIYGSDPSSAHGDTAELADREASGDNDILKGYWTIYIDILVMSHDGSIFDAAFMALSAALRDTRLPNAWFDADRNQIVCSPSIESSSRLRLRGFAPVSLSWRLFRNKEQHPSSDANSNRSWVLLDPDVLEEDSGACREGGSIIVDLQSARGQANGNGVNANEMQILKLEKNGGNAMGPDELKNVVHAAGKRWQEWNSILDKAAFG